MRNLLLFVIIAAVCAACGHNDSFTLRVEGGENAANLHFVLRYATADGSIATYTAPANENGEAVLIGNAPEWTLASILQEGGVQLAIFPIRNGEDATVRLNADATSVEKVEGTKTIERFYEFLESNNDRPYNANIEAYVADNPDDVVSGALMVLYYDSRDNERRADSLFTSIRSEARPISLTRNFAGTYGTELARAADPRVFPFKLFTVAPDSLRTIRFNEHSYTLFAFVERSGNPAMADSLTALQWLNPRKRLQIVEVSPASDSAAWRAAISSDPDTIRRLRGWTPSFASSPQFRRMSVPRLPFFILADSTGAQIYRGGTLPNVEQIKIRP